MGEDSGGNDPAGTDRESSGDRAQRIQDAWERERPGSPVGSIGVITRIWYAAKLFGGDRRRTLARLDMDSATLDLLSTLRRSGHPYRASPREVADRCMISKGAVTQRVTRAEAAGLVRALRSGGGRTYALELTDAGHRVVDDAVHRLLEHEDALIDHLDATERAELAGLLAKLLDGLLTKLDTPAPAGHVGDWDT